MEKDRKRDVIRKILGFGEKIEFDFVRKTSSERTSSKKRQGKNEVKVLSGKESCCHMSKHLEQEDPDLEARFHKNAPSQKILLLRIDKVAYKSIREGPSP